MSSVKSTCPTCGSSIEIPADLETLACSTCGTLYVVRKMEGSVGLTVATPPLRRREPGGADGSEDEQIGRFMALSDRLALLEEDIESVSSDLELIRSKQQGAPLHFGCAIFGLFGFVVLTMAFFATVGRSFFGGWLFYVALIAIVLFSVRGLRRKLMSRAEVRALEVRKSRLEAILDQLVAERENVTLLLQNRSD